MDFLKSLVSMFGDAVVFFIARATGWRPGQRAKSAFEWTGAVTGAILGVWGVIALIGGDEQATKADIEAIRVEFREVLAQRGSPLGPADSSSDKSGLGRNLDAAFDTILKAGKAEALKDKTGAAAEAAIDELIAERHAAIELVAKDTAALWRQKGALAFLRDTGAAIGAYHKAAELDPENAEGWNQLGHLLLRIGDLDGSMSAYARVLAIGENTKDQSWIAGARTNFGNVYLLRGELGKAEEMFRKALAIDVALGRKEGMAVNYTNLGEVYRKRGNLDKAEEMFRKSLAIDKEIGRKEGMAINYGNLGLVYKTRGDLDKAEEMFRKSLKIEEALGRKEGMAADYGNLGNVYMERGDLDKADEMIRKSLAIDESLGRKEGMATTYGNLGLLEKKRGNAAGACAHWSTARELFRELDSPNAAKVEGHMRKVGCGEKT